MPEDAIPAADQPAARGPAGLPGAVTQWIDYAASRALDLKGSLDAVGRDLDLKGSLDAAIDAAFGAARSTAATVALFSSIGVETTKERLEWAKTQYTFYEETAFNKLKEGVVVAAYNPGLSCGVAAGLGLVLLKKPRNILIHKTRGIFFRKEVLLSNAQNGVNELRQSVNLIANEKIKLLERARKADIMLQKGNKMLKERVRDIRVKLHDIKSLEREARDLNDNLNYLPREKVSQYKSEAAEEVSRIKKTKKGLDAALAKIVDYGVST